MIDLADAEKDGWLKHIDTALFDENRIQLYKILRRNTKLLTFVQSLPKTRGHITFSLSYEGDPQARLLTKRSDIAAVSLPRNTLRDLFVKDERATRAVVALFGYREREVGLYGLSFIMTSILMGVAAEQRRRAAGTDMDDAILVSLLDGHDA